MGHGGTGSGIWTRAGKAVFMYASREGLRCEQDRTGGKLGLMDADLWTCIALALSAICRGSDGMQ